MITNQIFLVCIFKRNKNLLIISLVFEKLSNVILPENDEYQTGEVYILLYIYII